MVIKGPYKTAGSFSWFRKNILTGITASKVDCVVIQWSLLNRAHFCLASEEGPRKALWLPQQTHCLPEGLVKCNWKENPRKKGMFMDVYFVYLLALERMEVYNPLPSLQYSFSWVSTSILGRWYRCCLGPFEKEPFEPVEPLTWNELFLLQISWCKTCCTGCNDSRVMGCATLSWLPFFCTNTSRKKSPPSRSSNE